MAFVLKIKLEGISKPPIWRKVKVNEHISFLDFHFIIQSVFDWNNCHLFQFGPKAYGSGPTLAYDLEDDMMDFEPFLPIEQWPDNGRFDLAQITLKQYFEDLKTDFVTYLYDFGDSWEHGITLAEKTDETLIHPICLSVKGKAPLEDIGGIWGHYSFVETINGPNNAERRGLLEWAGLPKKFKWDEKEFNLEEVNKRLQVM